VHSEIQALHGRIPASSSSAPQGIHRHGASGDERLPDGLLSALHLSLRPERRRGFVHQSPQREENSHSSFCLDSLNPLPSPP
jgi:hypothetical protein